MYYLSTSSTLILWLLLSRVLAGRTAAAGGGHHHLDPEQHVPLHASATPTPAPAQLCQLEPFGQWRIIQPGTCPTDGFFAAAAAAAAAAEGSSSSNNNNETTTAGRGDGDGDGDGDDDGWIRGSLCHEIPGGFDAAFCTFTHPSFSDGLGVSIVATPDVFAKISALPVFTTTTPPPASTTHSYPEPYYRAEPIPGKGIGLVAARALAAAETFLARTPAVMVEDAAFRRLGRARLAELLARAVDDLPRAHRAEYLALTTHDDEQQQQGQVLRAAGLDGDDDDDDRAYRIFMKNNFMTPVQDVEVFHSTFTKVSRINHACRPNSDYFFDDRTLSQNVFPARDVHAGEEITVTYSDPVQTRTTRQAFLLHHWGFTCTCALCTAPDAEVSLSDARAAEIRALWAELDDYSPASPATPAKAERVLALYRDEGLAATRMVEAYYRAAVEYSGVGDAQSAAALARRAVRAGEVMESAIRPFLANMRALARDPQGHWTWRFRLRDV